ncbi:PfkB family carbohydrate kinase [Kiritimatiella glycovorans]|uniref:Carbohydrate kinase n=1 Tax=Kiritimatiella glycovorans TaxID=1307763 RepID=A0A0G3EFV5_9BACT|nr:PfkB family carbohydrate kinase [Kiritimatiella glycovorans]AKJ65248.1 Carbohydrate kinase [Kiritimatiella glycovorans]
MHERKPMQGRPVVIGEVLFDCFPDGTEVLGGAPFNVAWHLAGLGLEPLLISRVGADERGRRIESAMREWGMDLSGIQRDDIAPTGEVRITLDPDGGHSFEILPDQAYDAIDWGRAVGDAAGAGAALCCAGSLIRRYGHNARGLDRLLEEAGAPLFLDVNLRAPWWDRSSVRQQVAEARWVKLNDEEIGVLGDRGTESPEDMEAEARAWIDRFGLEAVILTRGGEGSSLVTASGVSRCPGSGNEGLVDTVGAGDGFSAMVIEGLMRGRSASDLQRRAAEFASKICRIRGATVSDTGLYAGLEE